MAHPQGVIHSQLPSRIYDGYISFILSFQIYHMNLIGFVYLLSYDIHMDVIFGLTVCCLWQLYDLHIRLIKLLSYYIHTSVILATSMTFILASFLALWDEFMIFILASYKFNMKNCCSKYDTNMNFQENFY